jgi:hypothetical protein
MSARTLLADLQAAGARFAVDGDRLRVQPPAGGLTPDQREAITQHKAELLDLLRDPLMALIAAAIDGLPISPARVYAAMTLEDRRDVQDGGIGALTVRDFARSLVHCDGTQDGPHGEGPCEFLTSLRPGNRTPPHSQKISRRLISGTSPTSEAPAPEAGESR